MNNTISLSKILVKNIINSVNKNNKINMRTVGIVGLIIVSFLPIVINLIRFVNYTFKLLAQIGQEGILLSIGTVTTGFLIFLLGMFYIIGTFYFSNDIETLLPLPIKSYEIISAKFFIVLLYEYLTALFLLGPTLIIYGINIGAGTVYYTFAVLTFLLFPIIPLTFGAMIVIIIMRFSSVIKNKDAFKFAGGILALTIGLGINIFIQRTMGNVLSNPEILQNLLLEGNNSLVMVYTRIFPGLNFLIFALINSNTINGVLSFCIFIILTIALFALFLFLANKMYFRGVIGISETRSRKRELSSKELIKGTTKNSVVFSYVLKELRLLFRTPIYFLNCVLMSFIFPLFLLLPALTQEGGLSNISNLVRDFSMGILITVGFSITLFITSSNAITATSISREGNNYYVSKFIPVSYKLQIISKVLSGVVMGFIAALMLILVAIIVFKVNILISILTIIISLVGITFGSMIGITIDLYNPKLDWDNEQKAVKQNMNVLFHTIIGTIFAGLNVLIAFRINIDLIIAVVGLIIVYGILDLLMYKFLIKTGVKLYNQIGD